MNRAMVFFVGWRWRVAFLYPFPRDRLDVRAREVDMAEQHFQRRLVDRIGKRPNAFRFAAVMYTLLQTAKLNDIDPKGWARQRAYADQRSCHPKAG